MINLILCVTQTLQWTDEYLNPMWRMVSVLNSNFQIESLHQNNNWYDLTTKYHIQLITRVSFNITGSLDIFLLFPKRNK